MPDLEWTKEEGEILPGSMVGGDLQADEGYSVRFFPVSEPDDGLHAVVTVYCYPATEPDGDRHDANFPYWVQEQVEFTVCTDPEDVGRTEVYSDVQYEGSGMSYETLERADAEARRWVNSWIISAGEYLAWDGRSRIGW